MDYLFRGIARESKVRIYAVDAKESINNICKGHDTLPLTSVAFGKFLLAGTIIGALEKGSNGITMQINSDGPIKSLFMQATPNGLIRGYVGKNNGDLELSEDKLTIEDLVGRNGILSVTKSFDAEHNFTSDVILTASDISKDIAYYFFTSEQIPTIVNLQVNLDSDGQISDARGYLIQLMTGYDESDVEFLEGLKLDKITDLESNIKTLFPDFSKLEEIKVSNVCDCSKDKFAKGLATLPVRDLEDLANDESIEVVCQFCSKVYKFSSDDLKQIIDNNSKEAV